MRYFETIAKPGIRPEITAPECDPSSRRSSLLGMRPSHRGLSQRSHFVKATVAAAALVVVLWARGYAEDVSLERIVVTPSLIAHEYGDTSRAVDVISAKEIQASQAADAAEVLNRLPSVVVSEYGGAGAIKTIGMRGSNANQVLVLVDGIPLNSPRDGQVDLSTIPLEAIERIEVVHGPSSSLYGAGAMGGVVNLITKRPPPGIFETAFTSRFGTYRTWSEQLVHAGTVGSFGYSVNGGYLSSEGYRDNGDVTSKDAGARFDYALNDYNTLSFHAGFYKSTLGSPGLASSPDSDDEQRNEKNSIDGQWVFTLDDDSALSLKAYQQHERLAFMENTAGSLWDTAYNKDIHTTTVRGYTLQAHKRVTDFYQPVGGVTYQSNQNDSTTSAKHRYVVRALFLENIIEWFDKRLIINCAGRVDDYSNFGMEVNPSASALYKAGEGLKVRGAVSRSFRAPTFNDLYWPDQGWVKGNQNLKPETGFTREIGLDADINRYLTPSLTYHHSDYDDLINWAEEAFVWSPQNVNEARIQGVEVKNRMRLTDALDCDIGYTFLHAKDKRTRKYLIYRPRHKADLAFAYRGLKGLTVELRAQYTGERYHDAANTVKVERFYTVGANVSRRMKSGITCFLSLDNLFDTKYVSVQDYPMPGFTATAGLKLEL